MHMSYVYSVRARQSLEMMKPTARAPEATKALGAEDAVESSDAKDEKLKVVVRVRPLQKSEESWTTTSAGDQCTERERDAKDSSGGNSGAGSSSLSIQVSRSITRACSLYRGGG